MTQNHADRRGLSIRARAFLLVAVTFVPMAALFLYHTARDFRRAEVSAEESVLSVASEAAAGIEQFYDFSRRSVSSLAVSYGEALLDRDRCLDIVGTAYATVDYFANLVVFDAAGELVCGGIEGETSINVADRSWFRELSSGGQISVGEPAIGRILGEWVVAIAAAIQGNDGFVGVVAGTTALQRFQDVLTTIAAGDGALLTVTTRGNVVMARSLAAEEWIGRLLPTAPTSVEAVGDFRAITRASDAEGVPRIFGRIDLPGPRWRVFVGVPAASVYARERAALRIELLVGLLVAATAVGVAMTLQRGIVQALTRLSMSVRETARGRPVEVPGDSPPEVAEVVLQLNRAMEERQAALDLEAHTRDRLVNLVDNAVFGVAVAKRSGAYLEVNQAFAEMLGYESAETLLAADPDIEFARPERRDELLARYPTGSLIRNEEARFVRRDGATFLARMNGRAVTTPDGVEAFEVIVEDITKTRALEEMTRQQQKMDAVGRLAGGVAHEFNNLLTVMGVNTEFLMEEVRGDASAESEVEQIGGAVERAKALTRKLLAFSRKEIVQPRRADLSLIVREFEPMLTKVIPENVRIEVSCAPLAGPVLVDVMQIEQALLNLVINSRDAMPRGGRLQIVTEVREELVEDAMPGQESGSGPWAIVAVEDEGIGIDDSQRALVFEPFFTTKPIGEGTGLGLSTVYGIVSEAGGHVSLESARGEGTTIALWLPLAQD